MKTTIRAKWRGALGAFLLSVFAISAFADLQITGVPGFTFSDTAAGRPTVANLNRALRFTYQVSGTIGGTNAGIAAGSINPTHFATSVGGSNIQVTAAGLVVSNNAIGPNQLSTAAAGAGLGGGGGTALHILCDSNTIVNTGDVISVGTGLSNVNVSANAAIAVSKLAFSSNSVVGSSAYGTNTSLSLSNLTVSGTTLVAFGPKAQVVWGIAGSTVTVLASNNVSSVTRTTTGTYSVTFGALPNTNYVVSLNFNEGAANGVIFSYSDKTTTTLTVKVRGNSGSLTDAAAECSLTLW